MQTILFVCTGNTCRSPMAAAVMQSRIEAAGKAGAVQAASAGLTAAAGEPATANAVAAAAQQGLRLSNHRSRRLTAAMVQEADLVLTMTARHKEAVLSALPTVADKVYTFTEYAGFTGDITDPYGGDLIRYEQCFAAMQQCIKGIWQKFSAQDNFVGSF